MESSFIILIINFCSLISICIGVFSDCRVVEIQFLQTDSLLRIFISRKKQFGKTVLTRKFLCLMHNMATVNEHIILSTQTYWHFPAVNTIGLSKKHSLRKIFIMQRFQISWTPSHVQRIASTMDWWLFIILTEFHTSWRIVRKYFHHRYRFILFYGKRRG